MSLSSGDHSIAFWLASSECGLQKRGRRRPSGPRTSFCPGVWSARPCQGPVPSAVLGEWSNSVTLGGCFLALGSSTGFVGCLPPNCGYPSPGTHLDTGPCMCSSAIQEDAAQPSRADWASCSTVLHLGTHSKDADSCTLLAPINSKPGLSSSDQTQVSCIARFFTI